MADRLPNRQATERPVLGPGDSLDVVKIWKTVQGEGPFVGTPAVFVRLAGCNLKCALCDTDYTSTRKQMLVGEIVWECLSAPLMPLVVITGGEPFRQNISPLVNALAFAGCDVQVETNGTYHLPDFPYTLASVVCSPKTPRVHPNILHSVDAWKYVIQAGAVDPDDGLPTTVLGRAIRPARPPRNRRRFHEVFIQPCDEGDPERNRLNTQTALESCQKFGYRVSIQMHKILGLE